MLELIPTSRFAFAGASIFRATKNLGPGVPRGAILVAYPMIPCAGQEVVVLDDEEGPAYFTHCPNELTPWALRVVLVYPKPEDFYAIELVQAMRYRRAMPDKLPWLKVA